MVSGKIILQKFNLKNDNVLFYLANFSKIFVIVFLIQITSVIKTEYQMWGVLLILFIHAFYPFNNEINLLGKRIKIAKPINIVFFLMGFMIFAIANFIEFWNMFTTGYIVAFTLFTFIPAIIMLLHNGKKGPSLKYFFYIYYPAQFATLTVIYNLFK